jgi:hypothetical protein
MALQLAEGAQRGGSEIWTAYGWIYLFAFMVGFATTIAEPSLIAVAHKAEEASYKAISSLGLRIAVALSVSRSASPWAPSGLSPERRFISISW